MVAPPGHGTSADPELGYALSLEQDIAALKKQLYFAKSSRPAPATPSSALGAGHEYANGDQPYSPLAADGEAKTAKTETILQSKKIKYEFLCTLFGHGSRVYGRSFLGDLQMLEVVEWFEEDGRFEVACNGLDWNGRTLATFNYDFFIKEYAAEKPISSFEVFPVEFFHGDEVAMRQKLIARGRKFCNLCRGQSGMHCEYTGTALATTLTLEVSHNVKVGSQPGSSDASSEYTSKRDLPTARYDVSKKHKGIIIDNFQYLNSARNPDRYPDFPPLGKKRPFSYSGPDCDCTACNTSPLHYTQLSQIQPDSPEYFVAFADGAEGEARLLFLPPKLLGYVLTTRVWAQFAVEKIVHVDTTSSKKLLMALLNGHRSIQNGRPNDIIEGKGQGLAIMLHGPPGVGKTSTAETIALATNRPLLPVSVAEIGTEPHAAEEKLPGIFTDAARWNAVLLMDEANVFLEERLKGGEQNRNSMVSVLLRCLEYYEGIIILTTNRMISFDIALQSRIHLAIQYNDLSPEHQLQIYQDNLKKLNDDEIDREGMDEELKKIISTSQRINGRQIRNIVTGACAFAKSENGSISKLKAEHLWTVANATRAFVDSMATIAATQRGKYEISG